MRDSGSKRRQRYREVLRTYMRVRFLLAAVGGLFLIAVHSFDVANSRFTASLLSFSTFFMISFPLVNHLTEMLGSPRSRLMPGLQRTHLIFAAAFAMPFVVIIPLATTLILLGPNGPCLAIVAESVAAFAIGCLLSQSSQSLNWVLTPVVMWLVFSGQLDREFVVSLSILQSSLVLVASLALLMLVARRLARIEESTSGLWRRPFLESAGRLTALVLVTARGRPALGVDPRRRKLRRLGGNSPGPQENLWRRARHWDAAWGMLWNGATIGGLSGVLLLAMRFWLGRLNAELWGAFLIFLPLGALVPAVIFGQAKGRTLVAYEFLRPFSRHQHVRSAALACVGSVTLVVLLGAGIPLVGGWIAGRLPPGHALFFGVIASSVWLPIFLGAGMANLSSEASRGGLILCLICYGVYVVLIGCTGDPLGTGLTVLGPIVATVGLLVSHAAYRSWLNRDVG